MADLTGGLGQGINRDNPVWNWQLYNRYTSVVDAFQNYTNVLGFFAGTEVSNGINTTASTAYVKAAIRDVKAYIGKKNYRAIPVGYANMDNAAITTGVTDYLECGNTSEHADFQGLNLYSWCGASSLTQSGYSQRVAQFANFTKPVFLSEYGCNIPSPRNFSEVAAIYGSGMTGVFSGGIVYQYYADSQKYGKPQ